MRLIDYDAAIDRYYVEWGEKDICDGAQDRDWLKQCIDDAPTIDPKDLQPHGHWIEHPTGGLVCSHCDRYKPDEWRSMCCPNCGAILDGQVECDG